APSAATSWTSPPRSPTPRGTPTGCCAKRPRRPSGGRPSRPPGASSRSLSRPEGPSCGGSRRPGAARGARSAAGPPRRAPRGGSGGGQGGGRGGGPHVPARRRLVRPGAGRRLLLLLPADPLRPRHRRPHQGHGGQVSPAPADNPVTTRLFTGGTVILPDGLL